MSSTRIIIPFTAAERWSGPYAIPNTSLRDLEAATKWLTNSDSLWQEVTNLLNILSIPLFSNENSQSQILTFTLRMAGKRFIRLTNETVSEIA